MNRRDLYLAILHGTSLSAPAGWVYAVVTDGDLNTARAFGSRDAAVMELRRPATSAPLGFALDLSRPGVVAERIAGMSERRARARSGDRSTSHAAAASINPDTVRGRVLTMLRNRCGAAARFTLDDAVRWYGDAAALHDWPRASDSSVRTRVSELVADGYVQPDSERGRNASGRSVTLFRVVV